MIVHIIPAEKFVDRAVELFEKAAPGQNTFYIFSQEDNGADLNLVHTPESNHIFKISYQTKWWKKGFINFHKYQHIFFHNLYSSPNLYFANRAPKSLIRHSIIWGFEYYGFKPFWPKKNYGKFTKQLINDLKPIDESIDSHGSLKKFMYLINRTWKLLTDKEYSINNPTIANRKSAFKASNYIHTHVRTDYENIKQTFGVDFKWSNFSYYTTEDYDFEIHKLVLNRILIGNSATASNNHLEVFRICEKELESSSFEIICPLNYGDQGYAQEIEKYGKQIFGFDFKALTTFLSLKEYNSLQSTCGIVIMNHYRQQGAGNVIASLLFGSKVFMNKRSPMYQHFKSLNLHIFDVERDLNKVDCFKPLSSDAINSNRKIIANYYSLNTQIKSIRNSLRP